MTKPPLRILRECADSIEAETIRIRLRAADIRAFVTGTDAATALGLGGAGTMRLVRVEVDSEDYDRACELLENDQLKLRQVGPWVCSRCGEQNEAAFELCWSCNKPRTDDDQRGRVGQQPASKALDASLSIGAESQPPEETDANPYRPVLLSEPPEKVAADEPVASEQTAEDVIRCLRAAIVGVFLFPPLLGIYSVYLLIGLSTPAYRDRQLRRRIIIAWCINAVSIVSWLLYWWIMLT